MATDLPSVFSQGFTMPAPATGGMFGGGKFGLKEALAMGLAGFVSRRNPQLLQGLMQAMLYKQKQAADEAQYQRHRADDNADFQSHRQYEINNPLPQQPGEFETALMASGVQPGTPQWAQAMQSRVTNLVDPVVMTPQGPMLRSQLVGGGQPAPSGVTFTPIDDKGGPTPSASGGFSGGYI